MTSSHLSAVAWSSGGAGAGCYHTLHVTFSCHHLQLMSSREGAVCVMGRGMCVWLFVSGIPYLIYQDVMKRCITGYIHGILQCLGNSSSIQSTSYNELFDLHFYFSLGLIRSHIELVGDEEFRRGQEKCLVSSDWEVYEVNKRFRSLMRWNGTHNLVKNGEKSWNNRGRGSFHYSRLDGIL